MIDRKALLSDLQGLLEDIEEDLLDRSDSSEIPDVGVRLREEYTAAQKAERTAQSFEEWRSDSMTQVAAAWVLSCVFVRFLEDNELIDTPKISGPGERLKRARDEHEIFFRAHPTLTDREYLLSVFDALTKYAATKDIFGEHNPIRDLPNWLSGDAAGEIFNFFQRVDANTGNLIHDFTDTGWDTRFLGDLYQDLSEAAREKYALLQTPVFVEEFILDRTLDPAMEEFGLAKTGYEKRLELDGRLHFDDRFRMIDPACGSGHFLLGSFARLIERWRKKEPGARDTVLVQRALDSVHGVDLNPFAIAVARFRLLLAALKECRVMRLRDAPGFVIHLVCGDSLLHGSGKLIQRHLGDWDPLIHVYQPEDREALQYFLRPRTYHAVVANPPYITPKDSALNQAYRDRFKTCHRQYSLAVPFLERIVSLAYEDGYTGQITANSFMKREFGKKLVEDFLPQVDLTHVIDTSGAYIPGHGTPTVILFVRSRKPVTSVIRTVMGIRGEPDTPVDPSRGQVWSAILAQLDKPGSQSEFVSVCDSVRALFHKHPWSIGGGGAAELKAAIEESSPSTVSSLIFEIGRTTHTGEDDAFYMPSAAARTNGLCAFSVPLVTGERVRDYQLNYDLVTLFPYDKQSGAAITVEAPQWCKHFWRLRRTLKDRMDFGNYVEERGLRWIDHSMFFPARYRTPLSISFAEVSTHNHFVLDRGGKVFKQSAPVIKLAPQASEGEYLALLGLLNSSTACFWIKQGAHNKGDSTDQHGARTMGDPAFNTFAYSATLISNFSLSKERPISLALKIDVLAQRSLKLKAVQILQSWECGKDSNESSIKSRVIACQQAQSKIRNQLIALQEELDWQCYRFYGLTDEDLTYSEEPPHLQFGWRAFEIAMYPKIAAGKVKTTWFERHNATPLSQPHSDWPKDYQDLVRRRIQVITNNPNIALIEQPEYKRRWNAESWTDQLSRALSDWLLSRLESYCDFDGRMNDEGTLTAKLPIAVVSISTLADLARQDRQFHEVAALYREDEAFDVVNLVIELVESQSVPMLPILRYKPTGLRKRTEWENTWILQRQEDAIDARTKLPKDDPNYISESTASDLKKKDIGTIPVPPKYTSADFLKSDFWRLRGKLDVPKERWVSFPHCSAEDGTPMVAWAGYDHLQLAQSVSAYYVDVQERLGGRDDPRLAPLLACLLELLPWLKQWHNEIHPEFGVPMGDYFEGFLIEEAKGLSLTLDQLRSWQPPARSRSQTKKKGKKKAEPLNEESSEQPTGHP